MLAKMIGEQDYKDFIKKTNLLDIPDFELEELGIPLSFKWNKCKLETISYGHGIAVTPLQASATYAALTNGGNIIRPTIVKKAKYQKHKKLISSETSKKINTILKHYKNNKGIPMNF